MSGSSGGSGSGTPVGTFTSESDVAPAWSASASGVTWDIASRDYSGVESFGTGTGDGDRDGDPSGDAFEPSSHDDVAGSGGSASGGGGGASRWTEWSQASGGNASSRVSREATEMTAEATDGTEVTAEASEATEASGIFSLETTATTTDIALSSAGSSSSAAASLSSSSSSSSSSSYLVPRDLDLLDAVVIKGGHSSAAASYSATTTEEETLSATAKSSWTIESSSLDSADALGLPISSLSVTNDFSARGRRNFTPGIPSNAVFEDTPRRRVTESSTTVVPPVRKDMTETHLRYGRSGLSATSADDAEAEGYTRMHGRHRATPLLVFSVVVPTIVYYWDIVSDVMVLCSYLTGDRERDGTFATVAICAFSLGWLATFLYSVVRWLTNPPWRENEQLFAESQHGGDFDMLTVRDRKMARSYSNWEPEFGLTVCDVLYLGPLLRAVIGMKHLLGRGWLFVDEYERFVEPIAAVTGLEGVFHAMPQAFLLAFVTLSRLARAGGTMEGSGVTWVHLASLATSVVAAGAGVSELRNWRYMWSAQAWAEATAPAWVHTAVSSSSAILEVATHVMVAALLSVHRVEEWWMWVLGIVGVRWLVYLVTTWVSHSLLRPRPLARTVATALKGIATSVVFVDFPLARKGERVGASKRPELAVSLHRIYIAAYLCTSVVEVGTVAVVVGDAGADLWAVLVLVATGLGAMALLSCTLFLHGSYVGRSTSWAMETEARLARDGVTVSRATDLVSFLHSTAELPAHWSFVHVAALGDHLLAKRLIESGLSMRAPNPEGLSPMGVFAARGEIEPVLFLMNLGDDATREVDRGASAMVAAAAYGQADVLRAMVAHGADPDKQDREGRTPMYHAASADAPGAEEAVLALIEAGADVNQIDDRSWSPLHEASYWGRLSVIQLLVEYGADMTARTSAGVTPAALGAPYPDVVAFYRDAGRFE